jgi:hypothetical protein
MVQKSKGTSDGNGAWKGLERAPGALFDLWPPLLRMIDNFDWTSVYPAARVSARRHFIQTLE